MSLVSSLNPASTTTRAELESRLGNARTSLRDFIESEKSDNAVLRNALFIVRNEADKFVDRIEHARCDVAGKRRALGALLQSVGDLPDGERLRLKGSKLKPKASDSAVKNFFGIGQTKRKRQVQVLERIYKGSTCGELRAVQRKQASEDAWIVSCQFEESLTAPLVAAMNNAERLRQVGGEHSGPGPGSVDPRAVLELVREAAVKKVGAVKSSARSVNLDNLFGIYCNSVRDEHMASRAALGKRLSAEKDYAQAALREHKRQLRVQAQKKSVKDIVPADPAQRSADSKRYEKELLEAMGQGRLGEVLKTNYGIEAVNKMLRGLISAMDGKEITREIERCHGEVFTKGAADEGKNLRYYADNISLAQLKVICLKNRALMLNHYADGRPTDLTYRCAAHTDALIGLLRRMAASDGLVRPQQLMCTAEREQDARRYLAGGLNGLRDVTYEVTSFSSLRAVSRYDFAGEQHADYVLTPESAFRVLSVAPKGDGVIVRLQEVPASPEQLKDAQLLTL